MQLNNLLQANGGAGRLRWGDAVRGGPDHCPSWTIDAFRQSPNHPARSQLTFAYSRRHGIWSWHGADFGHSQGGSRSSSPEASPCSKHYTLVARAKFIVPDPRVSTLSTDFRRFR